MRGLILALVVLCASCTKSNKFVIEGTSAAEGSYYYMFKGRQLLDSVAVVNGKYRFSGEVDQKLPICNISTTNMKNPKQKNRFVQVVLDSRKVSVVEDDNSPLGGGLVVKGSKANEALYNFAAASSRLRDSIRTTKEKEQRSEYLAQYHTLVKTTIEENLDNFAGVYLLFLAGGRLSEQERVEFHSRLTPAMRQTTAALQLSKNIVKQKQLKK